MLRASLDDADNELSVAGTGVFRQGWQSAILEYRPLATELGKLRQAYAILGTAPVQGHISGVVDIPNACATLWLPTDIFEFDLKPSANGPKKYLDGSVDIPLAPDL